MSRPDPATGEQAPSGGEENPIDDIDESEDNDNGLEENPIENMEEYSNEDGDRLARVAWLIEENPIDVIAEGQARMPEVEARMAEVEAWMAEVPARMAEVQARMAEVQARMDEGQARMAEAQARMAEGQARMAEVQARMAEVQAWMTRPLQQHRFLTGSIDIEYMDFPNPSVSQQQPDPDGFPHQPGPGVSQATIDRLPSYQYTAEEAARKEDAFTCSICLGAVEPGQKVRVLTCKHKFHAPCVDQWLLGNRTCPMCRSMVQE